MLEVHALDIQSIQINIQSMLLLLCNCFFFYTSCILSERMSHLLVWNPTVNNHGGKGRNISLDLRLEHLNNLLKEMLRCLGVNVTEKSAKRCGEAMSILEEMLHKIDVELGVKEPSGHHITANDDQDFAALVKEIHERGGFFSFNPSSDRNYTKNFQIFKGTS